MGGGVSIYLDQRESPTRRLRRLALTLLFSLLFHLIALLAISLWVGGAQPVEAEEELYLPLSLTEAAAEPPPATAVVPPPEEVVEAAEAPDAPSSRLGWNATSKTQDDEPRPPGPEELLHAPARPNEEGDPFGSEESVEPAEPAPSQVSEEQHEEEPPPERLPEPSEEQDEPATPEEVSALERIEARDAPEEPGEKDEHDPGPPVLLSEPTRDDAPAPGQGVPREAAPRPSRERPLPLPSRPPPPRRAPKLDVDLYGGSWNNNIRFDTMHDEQYSSKVYWAIYKAWLRELWNNRSRFGRDQALYRLPLVDGKVVIHFTIHRDGGVDGLSIVTPSTMPTLDQASEAALLAAVLPQLPASFPKNAEGVTFSFALVGFPSAQVLERRLRIARSRGEF